MTTGSVSTASGSTNNNVPQGRIVGSGTSSSAAAGANASRPGAYNVSRLVSTMTMLYIELFVCVCCAQVKHLALYIL